MTIIERNFNIQTGETTERELTQAEIDLLTIPQHAQSTPISTP
jgi:hypothetical protein